MTIVIVKNPHGYSAAIRHEDRPRHDRLLTSTTHDGIYRAIDKAVEQAVQSYLNEHLQPVGV